MTAPKSVLNPGELLKQSPSTNTFQAINKFRDLMIRFEPYYQVYVVNLVFSSNQFNVCFLAKLFQYLSQSVANLSRYDRSPVFNTPNDVELQLVNRMTTALKVVFHSSILLFKRNHANKPFAIVNIKGPVIYLVIKQVVFRFASCVSVRTSMQLKSVAIFKVYVIHTFHTQQYTATNLNVKRKTMLNARKKLNSALSNQLRLIAGINPAQACQIHPSPEGEGLLWQKHDKYGSFSSKSGRQNPNPQDPDLPAIPLRVASGGEEGLCGEGRGDARNRRSDSIRDR
jgi:hypothetical protein